MTAQHTSTPNTISMVELVSECLPDKYTEDSPYRGFLDLSVGAASPLHSFAPAGGGFECNGLISSVCFVIVGPCHFLPYGDPIYPDAERQEPSEHEYLKEPTKRVDNCGLGAILLAQAQEERRWSQLHPSENGQEPN